MLAIHTQPMFDYVGDSNTKYGYVGDSNTMAMLMLVYILYVQYTTI